MIKCQNKGKWTLYHSFTDSLQPVIASSHPQLRALRPLFRRRLILRPLLRRRRLGLGGFLGGRLGLGVAARLGLGLGPGRGLRLRLCVLVRFGLG